MRFVTHDLVFAMPGCLTSPATTAGHTLMNASEHDKPKRLPRKQGLCQVANAL